MPLSRHGEGTYHTHLYHGTFGHSRLSSGPGPGIKSGISVRELNFHFGRTKKSRKKAQAGNQWSNILPTILESEEQSHH